ncbi:hypothetical protein O3M35_009755 [Rhynocoris fuscipes]|uniref:Odorant receptor n=1 Tax=Rhynocoris fuscipes TaxID=488301 RepID=A0AAW1D4V5_9HEMI
MLLSYSSLEQYRWELIKENKYQNEINSADYKCKKYIKYFNIFYLSFPFLSFISNFIADYSTNFKEPHLTHQVWIPWSMNKMLPYLAGTILITIMTLSTVVIYVSFCVLELTFTFQISAYLQILQHRLETQNSDYKTVYQHHQTVMQFLRIYNETCSVQMYIETLVASLEPCGFGFALIKGLKRYEPGTFDLLYKMILVLFGPYLLCYCGQEISTQMERLHESSYMSKWYDEKPKVRRDLYTMMLITIRPLTLNYRLFITFNFECFTTVF